MFCLTDAGRTLSRGEKIMTLPLPGSPDVRIVVPEVFERTILLLSIFNTSCKTTFFVVYLSYGEGSNTFLPLIFIPFGLKKGVEMRKKVSEVVKICSELVKISSGKITNLSKPVIPTAVKKLFCPPSVKSFGHLITLKMKLRKTGAILRGWKSARIRTTRPSRVIHSHKNLRTTL